jgi:hypothetical protein
MPVSLVAYIPNQQVVRRVENIMERYGKLGHAQAGRKMPSMQAHHVNNILAKFVGELLKLVPVQLFEVGRGIYAA